MSRPTSADGLRCDRCEPPTPRRAARASVRARIRAPMRRARPRYSAGRGRAHRRPLAAVLPSSSAPARPLPHLPGPPSTPPRPPRPRPGPGRRRRERRPTAAPWAGASSTPAASSWPTAPRRCRRARRLRLAGRRRRQRRGPGRPRPARAVLPRQHPQDADAADPRPAAGPGAGRAAGTVEDENIEGSRVGLVEGGQYPVSLLFQALVLQSGNDAANALARTAGGVAATVEAMNETAEAIGAFDTVAGTPSGLDVAGQSSSPYDLALIFRALIEDPATAAILTTPTAQMPPVADRSPGYQIQNQNPLLDDLPGQPRRQDRLHRRRPAHVRHGRRARRPPARGQRHGHRERPAPGRRPGGTAARLGLLGAGRHRGRRPARPPRRRGRPGRRTHPDRRAPRTPRLRRRRRRRRRARAAGGPEPSLVVPAALAGGAVLIVARDGARTRRRAVRPARDLQPRRRTRPRSAGGSTSRRP